MEWILDQQLQSQPMCDLSYSAFGKEACAVCQRQNTSQLFHGSQGSIIWLERERERKRHRIQVKSTPVPQHPGSAFSALILWTFDFFFLIDDQHQLINIQFGGIQTGYLVNSYVNIISFRYCYPLINTIVEYRTFKTILKIKKQYSLILWLLRLLWCLLNNKFCSSTCI